MKYPYYIVPGVEEYRGMDPDSEEARKLVRFISANVGDYASLRLILGIDPPEFARFYPDLETATPTTLDTIDSFLDKFGKNLPEPSLGEMVGGYVLEEDNISEETDDLETEDHQIVDAKSGIAPLARLLKEKRYTEAIAFIEMQNLNNPEKSIYFAHQIRFLKKAKAVENYRNKTQG